MRAAAILRPGCSTRNLKPFQTDPAIEWRIGVPHSTNECDVVLIFGGDGTIHRHLNSLSSLDAPVLVIPEGSGNDFARALGMRSARNSLSAWQKFCRERNNVRRIDLGVIRPLQMAYKTSEPQGSAQCLPAARYFCSVAGVGLDAEVARRANSLPRWLRGHGGYGLSLAPALLGFAPLPIKVSTRDEKPEPASASNAWIIRSDQPTMLAAFANTSSYGGGMKIAPQANVEDSLLDVCVIGGVNPFKLACMFPTVYFGRHLRIRAVEYFQTRAARVETEFPLDVYADGEYVCRTPVEISGQSGALKILMP